MTDVMDIIRTLQADEKAAKGKGKPRGREGGRPKGSKNRLPRPAMSVKKKSLSEREEAFVRAYCGDATEAAREAGYGTPSTIGCRLLQQPEIKEAIWHRRNPKLKLSTYVMSRLERQAFWTRVIMDETMQPLVRLRASELLGRSEGDFLDRHVIEDKDGKPALLVVKIPEPVEALLDRYKSMISSHPLCSERGIIDITPQPEDQMKETG